jgi:N-acetylglucosamine-6-phosphate deacetylase
LLTLDRALTNFIAFTGASVEQGLRLLTANPAAMTGLGDRTGSLIVGEAANLVAVDETGQLVASFLNGRKTAPLN